MIPDWLKNRIAFERDVRTLQKMLGKPVSDEASDAEVCACLMDASFVAPLNHDATEIYLFLATKLMLEKGMNAPDSVCITELTPEQEWELKGMREEIGRRLYRNPTPLESALKDLMKSMTNKQPLPPDQTRLPVEVDG